MDNPIRAIDKEAIEQELERLGSLPETKKVNQQIFDLEMLLSTALSNNKAG